MYGQDKDPDPDFFWKPEPTKKPDPQPWLELMDENID